MAALVKKAGVIGFPVAHSLSPLIHRTWAEREGVEAAYLPVAVDPDDDAFRAALAALARMGFAGVNVTLPHKERALAFADETSPAAAAAGAANMLTFRDDSLYADNSDIAGFAAALAEARPAAPIRKAVILGAGGAARAVAAALSAHDVGELLIVNRTPARALAIAARLPATTQAWEARDAALAGAELLVNTTSLGMTGAPPLDVALDALAPDAIVGDIVYHPPETALLAAARARGLATFDGLGMLMHQAAPGYRAWLGREAVVDADLRGRLERELDRRAP